MFLRSRLALGHKWVTASIKGRKQIAMIIKKLEFNRKGMNAGMAQVRERKNAKKKKKKKNRAK